MTQKLPTLELLQAGQSPWLDNISRALIESGSLKTLIEEKGLMGVTSNPTIFEKAIGSSKEYDRDIFKMLRKNRSIFEIYDALTVSDIQAACDLFLPVYKKSGGEHGFVSLEVSPDLSYDTNGTIAEARRLFALVNRPNVMIKIPATPEGIPAIKAVIAEGINVNVTLMFSIQHYRDVANAYLSGLKLYKKKGGDLSRVHSVASVFVSRIDSLVDKKLEAMPDAGNLKGKAAIANSRLIYQEFKRMFSSEDFHVLKASGARVQRPLWGSTSTKNPAYPDLIYVETLVGKDTVNTLPQNTLEAVLDHAVVRPNSIEEDLDESQRVITDLKKRGIDLIEQGEILQKEGVKSFIQSFDSLMKTLELKRDSRKNVILRPQAEESLSEKLSSEILRCAQDDQGRAQDNKIPKDFVPRLFKKDPTLWKSDAEHQKVILNRLGWLTAHDWVLGKLYSIDALQKEIRSEKVKNVVLLGMGGSSLAPEVMGLICERLPGFPKLHVVDTTDPASLLNLEMKVPLKSALFIVASKSGGTVETLSQFRYFFQRCQTPKKGTDTGKHFIAITDPGSNLEKLAREKKFRKIFLNPSDIGGRYSALSLFGMVPAALIGIDIRDILFAARNMFNQAQEADLQKNSAVSLGILMGELARNGKDKMTVWTSPRLASFGTWLEQLVAESTGKEGKGVIPVEGEKPLQISAYAKDRYFLALSFKGEKSGALSKSVKAVKKAGFPVVEIQWPSASSIGAEFLRWEIATAVASAVLGVNPFDEPNVKESKDNTGRILEDLKKKEKLEDPKGMISAKSSEALQGIFRKIPKGGYVALLAYLERSAATQKALDKIRETIAARLGVPVLVGFGPRYLHSIGQLYKGGTRSGLFLELLIREKKDVKIPGEPYTFGQLKKAQALGDMLALEDKGLPFLAIDLGKDPLAGLRTLQASVSEALKK